MKYRNEGRIKINSKIDGQVCVIGRKQQSRRITVTMKFPGILQGNYAEVKSTIAENLGFKTNKRKRLFETETIKFATENKNLDIT